MDVFLMLESSAATQALFPLISKVEMLGDDYPDMEDDKLWELITESALNDPANDMRTLFQLAYPGVESFSHRSYRQSARSLSRRYVLCERHSVG